MAQLGFYLLTLLFIVDQFVENVPISAPTAPAAQLPESEFGGKFKPEFGGKFEPAAPAAQELLSAAQAAHERLHADHEGQVAGRVVRGCVGEQV